MLVGLSWLSAAHRGIVDRTTKEVVSLDAHLAGLLYELPHRRLLAFTRFVVGHSNGQITLADAVQKLRAWGLDPDDMSTHQLAVAATRLVHRE